MYTIKRAAEVTGVAPATLRAWERRYGIGQPTRSDAGYRLYDEHALQSIRAMQLLLAAGWAPRQAASEVIRRGSDRPAVTIAPAVEVARAGDRPAIETFLAAARAMDDAAMRDVLDQGFAAISFEAAFDNWLSPALRAVGEGWIAGQIEVAAEHFASAAVMRRLSVAYEAASTAHGAPRILVGMGPGAFHEIGALAFATAAKRAGLAAVYVGANLPELAWMQALEQEPIAAVSLSLMTENEVGPARSLIQRIRAEHPQLIIAVGGPCAPALEGAARILPGGIAASVQQLLHDLSEHTNTQARR